jgi:NitT/TauT family transport system ATP-binding protein
MDEAFSALDVLTAENLRKEVLTLWQSKTLQTSAIVMVTHNIEEAVIMGDHLLVMGHNPGVIRVDMPGLPVEERQREHPENNRLLDYLYGVMTNPTTEVPPFRAEAAPVRHVTIPVHAYQVLPHVPVGQVTGLVEMLHAGSDRADIYALGKSLKMEVDDLLPLVQAIDVLGLGDIEAGDVYLTPEGVKFAEAGVLEEKEVFRNQALANVQLIKRILKEMDASPSKRVRWDTMLRELAEYFSDEEAERQLETAIGWGRYGELFAYDDGDGEFYYDKE